MDKVCRNSSVGKLYLESPRGAAAGPAATLRTCRSECFFPRMSCERSMSPSQEENFLLPAAGVRSPERPMPRLPTGPKRDGANTVPIRSSKSVGREWRIEDMKTPRSTAWAIGKGLTGTARDPLAAVPVASSPRSPRKPLVMTMNGVGGAASAAISGGPPPQAPSRYLSAAAAVVDGNPMINFGVSRQRTDQDWIASPRRSMQQQQMEDAVPSPRAAKVMSLRDFAEQKACLELPPAGMSSRRRSEKLAQSASPRMDYRASMSPTFRTSADFFLGNPSAEEPEPGSPYHAKRDRLADNPFSARRMRQQSGRITETTENVIEHADVSVMGPTKTIITNAEDFKASRGKRVGYGKEATEMAARFKMDLGQMEPARSQRRHHAFGDASPTPTTEEQTPMSSPLMGSPRTVRIEKQQTPMGSPPMWSPGRRSKGIVPQAKTSADMYASMKPDEADAPMPKYFVGNRVVEFHAHGRRSLADVARFAGLPQPQQVTPAGQVPQMSPTSDMPASTVDPLAASDQRSSELMRSHFVPQHSLKLSSTVPVVFASSPAKNIAVKTAGSMGSSMVPACIAKDAAYLQSGVTVIRHVPRTPGQFSPNLARTPVREIIHL